MFDNYLSFESSTSLVLERFCMVVFTNYGTFRSGWPEGSFSYLTLVLECGCITLLYQPLGASKLEGRQVLWIGVVGGRGSRRGLLVVLFD